VDFDSYAYVARPITGDFNAVNTSIDRLDANGGTNIGAGVSSANNQLINNGNRSHAWMMILLTDGQGSYSDYYTQQAKANNITIYTVGLGSSVDSGLLTRIATGTGGQYFQVASADELPQVFRNISEEIDPADSDGDGLSDTLEATGFRDGRGNGIRRTRTTRIPMAMDCGMAKKPDSCVPMPMEKRSMMPLVIRHYPMSIAMD